MRLAVPAVTAWSGHSTAPLLGAVKPAMMRSAVDLPQPEGPSSVRNSPAHMLKSSLESVSVPLGNVLSTPRRASSEGAVHDWMAGDIVDYCFGCRLSPTFLPTNCSV